MCFLQQWDLVVTLQRVIYSLNNHLGCFGVLMGPLQPTTQLDITKCQYENLYLVIKDGPIKTLSLPLFDFH